MVLSKVLIIDDDRSTRVALQGLFISRSWEVVVAETQVEGLAFLADYEPDWVIVAWGQLTATGDSFMRRVRTLRKETRVALLTEAAGSAEGALANRLRADARFMKPLSLDEVYRTCEPRSVGRKAV